MNPGEHGPFYCERMVRCPLNPDHQMRFTRLQYHLVKCKKVNFYLLFNVRFLKILNINFAYKSKPILYLCIIIPIKKLRIHY